MGAGGAKSKYAGVEIGTSGETMDTALQSVTERRETAVARAIGEIRQIEQSDGVNYRALDRIRERLIALAADRSLFPAEDFPIPANRDTAVYLLQEDDDGRFALYMSVGGTGKETPPHNHTTWAVITGLSGKEHNRLYHRSDDESVDGRGTVEEIDLFTVEHGNGITLLPEDIHSIHLEGEPPTLMLHMYGLALDRLHRRVAYNQEEGTYQHFPAADYLIRMTD